MVGMGGSWCQACGRHVQPGTGFCTACGQPVAPSVAATQTPDYPALDSTQLDYSAPGYPAPDATQLDYTARDYTALDYPAPDRTQLDYSQQGYPPPGFPPPPPAQARLPWPPPGNQQPGLPPAGQAPAPPPAPFYGAPVEQDTMSDTQRMLAPKGLFRGPGQFGEYQFSDQGQFGPGTPGAPPAWPGGGPGGPGAPGAFGPGGASGTLPRGMGGVPDGPMSRMPRPGGRLGPVLVGGGLIVVVALAAVLLTRHGGGGTPGSGTTASSTPTTSASAVAPSASAEHQAATRLAALLPQSGTDRGDVINAVTNVDSCSKQTLPKDVQTFTTSANNRQALLARLASLPGRSALPAAMITDLTGAWQASVQADTDLAKWAQDAVTHCRKGNAKDPNLAASYGPDNEASNDKQAFVRLWNPIARRFGLPAYTPDQL